MAPKARPASERFRQKTRPLDNGCVEWTGATTSTGYGSFYARPGEYVVAHRWAYENAVGEIPPGLQLDHLCRNRRCVNPRHLEPVTPRENLMRSDGFAAKHARATHCPAGHPYAGPNLYTVPKTNHRACRTCARANRLRRDAERKGAKNLGPQ